jgi:glucokinase
VKSLLLPAVSGKIIALPMSENPFIVGLDLGGTEIKAVAFSKSTGEALARESIATRDGESPDGSPSWLKGARELLTRFESQLENDPDGIGVAAPGLVNPEGTAIAFMPGRLKGIENLHWGNALGRQDEVPVLNDAHAALLGEIWQGSAKDLRDVVLITLGTGVGGAIVSDGRLLKGHIGRAGHIGHTTIDFEGAPDICNTPGSIEDAIGEASLVSRSGGHFYTTEDLVGAFVGGVPRAGDIWQRSLRALAATIVSTINMVDPEAIIIGGGIAEAGKHLFPALETLLEKREWRPAGARVRILPAELGPWAGAYGAARRRMET